MFSTALFTVSKKLPSFSLYKLSHFSVARNIITHTLNRHEDSVKKEINLPSKEIVPNGILSQWYALPIGIAAAVPALKFEWYVINEETQLAAVFIAFCVTVYKSGGDAIFNFLDQRAQSILKDHNTTEDKVIKALQSKLDFLKANQNMVDEFENINRIREEAYKNLSLANANKPKHDLKNQIERILNKIVAEEAKAADKTKIALMDEATSAVRIKFLKSKQLKKSALDVAIAAIQGKKVADVDPVHMSFIQFFKEKSILVSKEVDESDNISQRSELISKLNTLCRSERFYFDFDASGKPNMLI